RSARPGGARGAIERGSGPSPCPPPRTGRRSGCASQPPRQYLPGTAVSGVREFAERNLGNIAGLWSLLLNGGQYTNPRAAKAPGPPTSARREPGFQFPGAVITIPDFWYTPSPQPR